MTGRAAFGERLLPFAHGRPAIQRARRNVSAAFVEAAMQAISRFDLRLRVSVVGDEFFAGIDALCHCDALPGFVRVIPRVRIALIFCQFRPEVNASVTTNL